MIIKIFHAYKKKHWAELICQCLNLLIIHLTVQFGLVANTYYSEMPMGHKINSSLSEYDAKSGRSTKPLINHDALRTN